MPTWLPATVSDYRTWCPGLASLVLDRSVPFRSGQFVTLTCHPEGGRKAKRAYSIASAPGEPLEFYIVEVEGGAVSPGLCALKQGDPVFVSDKGKGLFTLDEVPDGPRDLWMIATGTGLAPFRSMLRTPGALDRFEHVVVVYGARRLEQLGYLDELHALQRDWQGRLIVIPLISREEPPEHALPGRVTDRLRDGSLEARAGLQLSPEHSHVMLCGNPAMIAQMNELLGERDMVRNTRRSPGHITTEKYW